MLDLNVDAVYSVDSASCDDDVRNAADSVTSSTTTTTNNAAADEADSNRGRAVSTLNFSILNKNVIEIDDDVANNKSELQLFPAAAACGGGCPLSPSVVRAKCWLNLSVPEREEWLKQVKDR